MYMATEKGIYTPSKTRDMNDAALFLTEPAALDAAQAFVTAAVAMCGYFEEADQTCYWIYYQDGTYLKLTATANDNGGKQGHVF